jgi:hypothetical protein
VRGLAATELYHKCRPVRESTCGQASSANRLVEIDPNLLFFEWARARGLGVTPAICDVHASRGQHARRKCRSCMRGVRMRMPPGRTAPTAAGLQGGFQSGQISQFRPFDRQNATKLSSGGLQKSACTRRRPWLAAAFCSRPGLRSEGHSNALADKPTGSRSPPCKPCFTNLAGSSSALLLSRLNWDLGWHVALYHLSKSA